LKSDIVLMLDGVLVAEPALVLVALLFFILRPAYAPQALLLALAPWGARWARRGYLTATTALDTPLVVFLIGGAVGVWTAYDPEAAWQKFWLIVGGVLLYYAIVNTHFDPTNGNRTHLSVSKWVLLFGVLGAALSFYFTTQHDYASGVNKFAVISGLGVWIHAHAPILGGDVFHPNVVGGILAVILPLNVALVWHLADPERASVRPSLRAPLFWVSVGTACVIAFGLVMTESRGAWLALSAATAAWLIGPVRRRWVRLGDGLAVAVILATAVVLIARPARSADALDRLVGTIPAGDTAIDRLSLYRDAQYLLEETVFTGGGLASFPMRYSTYVLDIPVLKLTHAHNLYLDVWLEQGLLGILGLLGLLGTTVWTQWRWRGRSSRLLAGATVALMTLLLHGLVDDVLYSSRALPLLFVPFALIVRRCRVPVRVNTDRARRRPLRALAWSAALVLVVLMLAGLRWRTPIAAAWHADLGTVAQTQTELRNWPDVQAKDVRRTGDLSAAVSEFRRALALDPQNRTANRRLGLIAVARDDYVAAVPLLEQAYRSAPGDNMTESALALAYVATGQVQRALPLLRSMPDALGLLADEGERWQKAGHPDWAARANAASMALLPRRDVTFRSAFDGSEQKYLLVPPMKESSAAPPLVLYLHSLGNDPYEYLRLRTGTAYAENLAVYLSRKGVLAVAPVYRGDSWGNDAAVADITQVIREVQAKYGHGPVYLAGLSMGATAAVAYAVLAPDDIPVRGIVTALGTGDLQSLWEEGGLRGSIAKALGGSPLEIPNAYRMRSALRRPERLGSDVAVAILSAASDTVIPPHHQEALRDTLRAQGTPVLFLRSEGGHSPNGLHFRQAFDFVLDR